MQIIEKYFPNITLKQRNQFLHLEKQYIYWNNRINVISRKSIHNFYTHHILHSLSISKLIKLKANTSILDVGTGGGFPGIPLAILFPEVNFTLVDSIGKKIKVVKDIIKKSKLSNVQAINTRAEHIEEKFDFIISRAVTNMTDFRKIIKGKIKDDNKNLMNNGIFYLKGGDLSEELRNISYEEYNISDYFQEDFFKTKKIIYVPNIS